MLMRIRMNQENILYFLKAGNTEKAAETRPAVAQISDRERYERGR